MPDASPFQPDFRPQRQALYLFACLCLLAAVFATDLLTPLGFAHGMLYAPAIVLALLAHHRRAILLTGAAAALLTLLGAALSPPAPPGMQETYIALNRGLAMLVIGMLTYLALQVLRLIERVEAAGRNLQAKSTLLTMASDLGHLGGWSVDLASGIVTWSDEVSRIHGKPAGFQPTVAQAIAFYAPESQAAIETRFQACATSGEAFDEELVLLGQDGQRRWVRSVGQAVRDDSGRVVGVQGAFQDIDDLKQSQLRLERSLERWHTLAEAMPITVWTATPAGGIDFLSRSLQTFTGEPLERMLGTGWLAVVHPDDRDETMRRWTRSMDAGTPFEAEFRVRRHDGTHHWHLSRAVRVLDPLDAQPKWYGTAVDIDEHRRLREAAETLAGQLSATMESVTDAIFTLDRDWRFTYLNRHAERLLEDSRDALLGRIVWEAFPDARGTVFQSEYEKAMAQQMVVRFDAPYPALGKHFEVNGFPSATGLTVYFRDITEQRQLAEHLQQAQRLESLGQLTGGVAHDFNNLLTVIMGNAELLSERASADADVQQRLLSDMIAAAAQRGAELTQRLLAFARRQALEPRAANLNRLLSDFEPVLQRALGEHIEVEMVQAAGLWPTLVDPAQLESAVLNLAINARDAMPGGGRLTIETANARLDDAYAAQQAEVAPGQYVMLAVSDTGEGIDPALLARVFEPFFTTKEKGKGTGLGLAMVYGFVKQSRGHVSIYSEPQRGTTVKIYLPRLTGADAEIEHPAQTALPEQSDGHLILLVEDDAMVRQFAFSQLQSLGYRVLQAETGRQALERLNAHPEIDLLFTDVVIPGGMSGRQLAEAAMALRPGLPVLYTSGYTENAIVHHGRLDPGVLLLGKPYRRAELAKKIQMALDRGRAATGAQAQASADP